MEETIKRIEVVEYDEMRRIVHNSVYFREIRKMAYKTCVSIAEKTPKKLKQTLTKALKKSDYAEIRFDFLNPNVIPEALHLIRKDLRKCVSTLRPINEGGNIYTYS